MFEPTRVLDIVKAHYRTLQEQQRVHRELDRRFAGLEDATLALVLSAANVFLRDIQYLIEVVVMLLMWASPIVYSWNMVKQNVSPLVLEIYTNNPITLAVMGFQKAFWVSGPESSYPADLLLRMGVALGIGLVGLVAAHAVFNRMQGDFAQAL